MINIKTNREYFRSLFLLFCFCLSFGAHGQQQTNNDVWDLVFINRHYSITIIPGITSSANFENNDGRYHLGSSPQPQVTAGFGYHLHLGQNQSLISGLNFGTLGRNFQYRIPASYFDSAYKNEITRNGAAAREYEFAYLSVPIGFENRWLRDKGFVFANAGVAICYGLQKGREWNGAWVSIPGRSGAIRYFEMPLNKDNNNKIWLNYNVGGGYGFLLSNKNILKVNLLLNVSNTDFMKGEYRFEVPGQTPSIGIYKIKGSYIGIGVSYVLTRTNKTLERMQRREF